jgi:hypothetical protein
MCGLDQRTRQLAADALGIKKIAVTKIYAESLAMMKRWFDARRLSLRDFA